MSGQVDGSCFGKLDAAEAAAQDTKNTKKKAAVHDGEYETPKAGSLAMPSFLKLTEQGEFLQHLVL